MRDAVLCAWAFRSSAGTTTYETQLTETGVLSCNCPGWTIKRKGADDRSCKHTREVEREAGLLRLAFKTARNHGAAMAAVRACALEFHRSYAAPVVGGLAVEEVMALTPPKSSEPEEPGARRILFAKRDAK